MPIPKSRWLVPPALVLLLIGTQSHVGGSRQQSPPFATDVDRIARSTLASTGVPSVCLAVVKDGQVAYLQAYGNARLSPATPATSAMRYSVGSISKQFTSTALLLLQDQHKLSLDDPVGKYVAGLTRGNEVTLRQILSHTSGYQDYWPQDYVPPFMLARIDAQGILDRWARRPLDFAPGTQWQYSNTNYVIAGLVVEKVSGTPLWQFLNQKIFTPLGMTTVTNVDEHALPEADATGYFRYALGPLRPAPKEGPGWLFAAGELGMTASDLAKWDLSIINQAILTPAAYQQLGTETRLKNGVATNYGLGVQTRMVAGHHQLEHTGEVSGFTAENIVLPDEKAAVVVFTNQDAVSAASSIGQAVVAAILPRGGTGSESHNALVAKVFNDLRQGKIDRALFTDNANAYFTDQALADYAAGLSLLGEPKSIMPTGVQERGGMTHRGYVVRYADKTVVLNIFEMPDGKFEQFLVEPAD